MENIDYNGQKDLHITCYLLAPRWIPTPKGKWLTKFKKINKTKPRNRSQYQVVYDKFITKLTPARTVVINE